MLWKVIFPRLNFDLPYFVTLAGAPYFGDLAGAGHPRTTCSIKATKKVVTGFHKVLTRAPHGLQSGTNVVNDYTT